MGFEDVTLQDVLIAELDLKDALKKKPRKRREPHWQLQMHHQSLMAQLERLEISLGGIFGELTNIYQLLEHGVPRK